LSLELESTSELASLPNLSSTVRMPKNEISATVPRELEADLETSKAQEIFRRRKDEHMPFLSPPGCFDEEGGFEYHHHEDATVIGMLVFPKICNPIRN
tara:strand:- start:310 stop:603 length:294 start_codon:yes stop_codon:yes gene_type:complete